MKAGCSDRAITALTDRWDGEKGKHLETSGMCLSRYPAKRVVKEEKTCLQQGRRLGPTCKIVP